MVNDIDRYRIAAAARWDGLRGGATNICGMSAAELFERCRGLWQVERGFRVSRHDLN